MSSWREGRVTEAEWAHRPPLSGGESLELGLGQPPAERKPTPLPRGQALRVGHRAGLALPMAVAELSKELDCRAVSHPTQARQLAGSDLVPRHLHSYSPDSDVCSRHRATVAHEHTARCWAGVPALHSPGSDTTHLQQGPAQPQAIPLPRTNPRAG